MNILQLISDKTLEISGCKISHKNSTIVVLFKPNDLKLEKFIIPIHEYKQLRAKGLI